ncbi:hypothetical protein ACFQFC_06445 [Amorphoplanes digitatis]|uniref:Multidrug efflux pump subunit AcrA (Membrane-fusion protein) n=1 Tax=Actinoplanes digitatis TaxID=1868 RepID=A0A7W7MRQ0_9ACTN|nr:hypothetical protein [Actinoplanes digitatis]MBB4763835.1 multidrug efflux pump subunit AcrA (membrane-fusion protein) [Actinoplanes digitatis]BFE73080.1 hypothetical protein GCM10020092_063810 [Actinoplanes digitatis]GID95685.1 hypothetical protein Adi01nite_50970 [Actinoplanes digitatis]
MTEPTGVEALRAGHRALSAAIEVFDAARAASTEAAIARQRAAHDAERRACDRWSALSEARRAAPGDLRLVARADQAHGAYEAAREASRAAAREAAAVARAALEESARDSARLSDLGARCRAAARMSPRAEA